MDGFGEILGELLTTALITKKGIYFILFLLGVIGMGCYFYFCS